MGKQSFWEQRFRYNLGIHEQPNFAQNDHIRDCRNVWAPEGEIVSRPGSEPLNLQFLNHELKETTPTGDFVAHFYDDTGSSYTTAVGGSDNLTLTGFTTGDILYIGADSADITTTLVGYQWRVGQVNSEKITLHWEYYDGSAWKALKATTLSKDEEISTTKELCGGTAEDLQKVFFWLPSDAADFALNDGSTTYTKRYIRAKNLVGTVTNPTRLDINTAGDFLMLELDTDLDTKIAKLQVVEEVRQVMMSCGWESASTYKVAVQYGLGREASGPKDVSRFPNQLVEGVAAKAWIPETSEMFQGIQDQPIIESFQGKLTTSHEESMYPVIHYTQAIEAATSSNWSGTLTTTPKVGSLGLVWLIRDQNAGASTSPLTVKLGTYDVTQIVEQNTGTTYTHAWCGYVVIKETGLSALTATWSEGRHGAIMWQEIRNAKLDDPITDSDGGDDHPSGVSIGLYNTGQVETIDFIFNAEARNLCITCISTDSNPSWYFQSYDETYEKFDLLEDSTRGLEVGMFSKNVRRPSQEVPSWEAIANPGYPKGTLLGIAIRPADTGAKVATVEDEFTIVNDTRSPYYEGYLAQLKTFPRAKRVTYFKNHLFLTGIPEFPRMIRWSMSAPAHKVFAELGFTYVGGTEGDELTGFIQYGEHLLVAEPQNIWRLAFTEIDSFGVPHWEAAQFISGTGCINTQTAVNTKAGLVFLSDNGLMLFNGSVKKISDSRSKGQATDRLQSFWKRVHWAAAASRACAVDWKTKGCYLVALPIDGSTTNNIVLVWDYENNTLWLWNSLDIQDMEVVTGLGEKEQVVFVDKNRVIWRLVDGATDNYGKISCSVTTHRLNQGNARSLKLRECEISATNLDSSVSLTLYQQDQTSGKSYTYDFSNTLDGSLIGTAGARLVNKRERQVKKPTRLSGESFYAKLTNGTTGKKFRIRDIFFRGIPLGRR